MTGSLWRNAVRFSIFAVLWPFAIGPALAQAGGQDPSYLQHADIGYIPAPAPKNASRVGQADLAAVKVAQKLDEARRRQAYEDAGAYGYELLLPRFSEAAGTELSLHTRPILAHMLMRLLVDTGYYANNAKYPQTPANERDRPYVGNPSVIPCETDFLYQTDQQSYPSGHATNGYAAALLIADAMSGQRAQRRPLIVARGVRYGDNRVVCGVHNPSDVRAGQELAQHIYDKARLQDDFKADLICAQIEDARSPAALSKDAPPPYGADCDHRRLLDIAEAAKQAGADSTSKETFPPE